MAEVTLNRDDSMRILNDPASSPEATLIAACAVTFFAANDAAEDVDDETRTIAHKLLRMTATRLDEEA